jgi:hypothetical protein
MEPRDLLLQLALVSSDFNKARGNYNNVHKTFQIKNDARLTIYTHCIIAIDSSLLYLMFRTFEMPSDLWWNSLPQKFAGLQISKSPILKPSQDNLEVMKKAVDSYWIYSAFILLFSSLESSIRTIVRAVYAGDFDDGRGNFKDICIRLLQSNFSKYECLLELLRLGRNTMHNNGVYFPEKKGDDRQVTYKNITYDFIDGQIVRYGDLSKLLFFDIAPDMLTMINDIVNSPSVSNLSQIIDPSEL